VVVSGGAVEGGAAGLPDHCSAITEVVPNVDSNGIPSRHVTSTLSVCRLEFLASTPTREEHRGHAEDQRGKPQHVIKGHLPAPAISNRRKFPLFFSNETTT